MAVKLFLLRHGRTGMSGRYVGSSDVPMSQEGEEQIQSLRYLLARESFDRVLCSPMLRCRRTLELLELDCPVEFDPDLREIDFGRWEGKTFQEIAGQDSELVSKWAEWSDDFSFPEGEKLIDFLGRVEKIRRKIPADGSEKILLISHGGIIRGLICAFLGLPPEKHLLFRVSKGAYSVLDIYDKGGVLTGFNLNNDCR